MADLLQAYASKDEIPEEFRSLPWVEDAETKHFVLDQKPSLGYTRLGPKGSKALEIERNARRDAERKVTEIEQKIAGLEGLDLKAARDAMARVQDLETQLGSKGQEAERAIAERLARQERALQEKHAKEVEGLKAVADRRLKYIQGAVGDRLRSELSAAKALGGGEVLSSFLREKINVREEGDQIITEILGDQRAPRYSPNDPSKLMSLTEYVQEVRGNDDFAIYFEGSGATGGGTPAKKGSSSGKSESELKRVTRSQYEALPLTDKASGGFEIVS